VIMGNTFPNVKRHVKARTGNTLPPAGNNLPGMGKINGKKRPAVVCLAENLKTLMSADANLSSGPKVAKAAGISRKSINNIIEKRHDPRLSSVDEIARAFRLEAYQILTPGLDENLLVIFRSYMETDDSGRNLITAAAEAATRAHERKIPRAGADD
jgi:DNA-binding XRE family transcriptional regulator